MRVERTQVPSSGPTQACIQSRVIDLSSSLYIDDQLKSAVSIGALWVRHRRQIQRKTISWNEFDLPQERYDARQKKEGG